MHQTKSNKFGYVKFKGKIANNLEIDMYGLELDIANVIFPGNDGSFNGVKYFDTTLGREGISQPLVKSNVMTSLSPTHIQRTMTLCNG